MWATSLLIVCTYCIITDVHANTVAKDSQIFQHIAKFLSIVTDGGRNYGSLPLRLSPYHRTHLIPRKGLSGVSDSLGLTGGVYKARERIQCAIADAHLLAIPASRGRVAALDPN